MTSPAVPITGAGERMHALASRVFPLCRSITGDGVRETLREVAARIPLEIHEVPSGTQVLDWTVPDEWNIREAYIATADGRRVVDFAESNLHVVSYSEPLRSKMTLDGLRPHLHVHPERPDWIPYRTSYYTRNWGFCLSRNQLEALEDGTYEVVIDSTLAPGSLTYGECFLPGQSEDEIVLTTHVCHPSLANDNVSGIVLLTEVGVALAELPRRYSYRLLFIPGTIGSVHMARAQRGRALARRRRPGDRLRRRLGASDLQAESSRRRAGRSGRRPRRRERAVAGSSTSFPGAGTSVSSTRRASTSQSAVSPARSRASSPSTTPRPTTST